MLSHLWICVCVRVSDGYCLVSDGFCLGSLNPGSTLHPGFPRHISTLRQQVGRMSRSELPSQAPGRRFPEFHTICCFVYKGIWWHLTCHFWREFLGFRPRFLQSQSLGFALAPRHPTLTPPGASTWDRARARTTWGETSADGCLVPLRSFVLDQTIWGACLTGRLRWKLSCNQRRCSKDVFFGGVGATYSISIALLQKVIHLSFMVQSTLRQSCGYWAGLCGHEWVHSSKSGAIHGLSWTGPFCDGKNGAVDLGWRLGVALSSTFWVRALKCHYQSIIYHYLDPKQFNKARGKGYINDGQKLVDGSCILIKGEGQPRI